MSAPELQSLVEITSTRLTGVAATLRELAETRPADQNMSAALHLMADCVALSSKEIDEVIDP